MNLRKNMGNQYEFQHAYYNKNLDNMNSLIFNQNSNNDFYLYQNHSVVNLIKDNVKLKTF